MQNTYDKKDNIKQQLKGAVSCVAQASLLIAQNIRDNSVLVNSAQGMNGIGGSIHTIYSMYETHIHDAVLDLYKTYREMEKRAGDDISLVFNKINTSINSIVEVIQLAHTVNIVSAMNVTVFVEEVNALQNRVRQNIETYVAQHTVGKDSFTQYQNPSQIPEYHVQSFENNSKTVRQYNDKKTQNDIHIIFKKTGGDIAGDSSTEYRHNKNIVVESGLNKYIQNQETGTAQTEIHNDKATNTNYSADQVLAESINATDRVVKDTTIDGVKDSVSYDIKDSIYDTQQQPIKTPIIITTPQGNDRNSKVIAFLSNAGQSSIVDIAKAIPGVSLKTVQRQLNTLIGQGVVKRVGDKRWSAYVLTKGQNV